MQTEIEQTVSYDACEESTPAKAIIGSPSAPAKVGIAPIDIEEVIIRQFRISYDELVGDRRVLALVWPRHIAFWLASELTMLSAEEIGQAFKRDRATVRYGIRQIKKRYISDPDFAREAHKLILMVMEEARL